MTPGRRVRRGLSNSRGQSIIEFAVMLPLICVVVLGVVEVGYALLDQQVVNRISREGSNLISRDTSLQDAGTAMASMSSRPVDFNNGSSRLIFSVILRGATVGTANYNQLVLYQRYEKGTFSASSKLTTSGGGLFNGPPEYTAVNVDTNTGLRVTNVPGTLIPIVGGMIYVTEVYTRHTLITPFNRFGVVVPQTLYSIAYF